jgi:exopolysaccharide/PEP-CTERM locus tyrosine autokinase
MNLIERAGKRLGLTAEKSLVEKAAERFEEAHAVAELGRPAAESAAGRAARAPQGAGARRETRRQIAIDFDRLRTQGYALPVDQSALAEELRLIKRPLLGTAFAQGGSAIENSNLIMVTSANPNEGKTFIATNLALSMASEHDVHVLLVDADTANPSIPLVLGFDADTGLIDAVSDASIDLADVMIRTNIDNLIVLPAGRPRPGASELLASARMTRFVNDIAKRYADRVIIFDSPPVLARSEAMVLAQHVGQVVFVVEAERTSRTAMSEALGMIGTKLGGVVLNKTPQIPLQEGFGYYEYRNR